MPVWLLFPTTELEELVETRFLRLSRTAPHPVARHQIKGEIEEKWLEEMKKARVDHARRVVEKSKLASSGQPSARRDLSSREDPSSKNSARSGISLARGIANAIAKATSKRVSIASGDANEHPQPLPNTKPLPSGGVLRSALLDGGVLKGGVLEGSAKPVPVHDALSMTHLSPNEFSEQMILEAQSFTPGLQSNMDSTRIGINVEFIHAAADEEERAKQTQIEPKRSGNLLGAGLPSSAKTDVMSSEARSSVAETEMNSYLPTEQNTNARPSEVGACDNDGDKGEESEVLTSVQAKDSLPTTPNGRSFCVIGV